LIFVAETIDNTS